MTQNRSTTSQDEAWPYLVAVALRNGLVNVVQMHPLLVGVSAISYAFRNVQTLLGLAADELLCLVPGDVCSSRKLRSDFAALGFMVCKVRHMRSMVQERRRLFRVNPEP